MGGEGSGLRLSDSGFKIQGSVFRVQGSGFRVQGSGEYGRVQDGKGTARLAAMVQGVVVHTATCHHARVLEVVDGFGSAKISALDF